jgi:hypothetical protein
MMSERTVEILWIGDGESRREVEEALGTAVKEANPGKCEFTGTCHLFMLVPSSRLVESMATVIKAGGITLTFYSADSKESPERSGADPAALTS